MVPGGGTTGQYCSPTKTIQNNTDLLFRRILSAGRPLDVFDELLAMALTCLSHVPLLRGYDEPEILSYQIILFGPASADGRHQSTKTSRLPKPRKVSVPLFYFMTNQWAAALAILLKKHMMSGLIPHQIV